MIMLTTSMRKGRHVVTPDTAMSIDQTPPLLSSSQSNSAQEGKRNASPNSSAALPKEGNPLPVDTVSLSTQSQQAISAEKKEEAKQEEAKKVVNVKPYDQAPAKVEIVYDQKGTVITKYMDTADRLIYQVPSELTLLLRETVSKADTSVDTKA